MKQDCGKIEPCSSESNFFFFYSAAHVTTKWLLCGWRASMQMRAFAKSTEEKKQTNVS